MEIFVQFKVNSLILIFAFCVRIRFCLAIDADFSGRRIDWCSSGAADTRYVSAQWYRV